MGGGDIEGGSGRGGASGDGEATRGLDEGEWRWLMVIGRGCEGDPGCGWAEGKRELGARVCYGVGGRLVLVAGVYRCTRASRVENKIYIDVYKMT